MHLYNLTLQGVTAINQAVHGCFSGISKQQEVCVARGSVVQLLFCDPKTGKISVLCSQEIFGVIRSLLAFRLTGGAKDYIAVGSDSGRIVILEYLPQKKCFDRVHQETYGKTGCRRIVPGQYLAVDPKGRAICIGAVEKQKLVYILNRDAQANLTISSPLEAHKNYSICFAITGIDVGFENPTFACLEVDYEDVDHDPTGAAAKQVQQTLTFYELDLGLNHVVRKYAEPVQEQGNHLISVPGGHDGPSGVIICCENYLVYKNLGDQPDIRCPIPRRRNELDESDRPLMIVCSATHKTKSMYFFLVQSEQGDVFKVTLEADGDIVTEMRIKYFDTLPTANSMCILKTGFLFVASEFGNHSLYQIVHLGENDEEPEFSSRIPLDDGETFFYDTRPLHNLILIDQMDSLCPLISSKIADLANEDAPQIYALCGRGPRSTMRVLRNGLEVSEMAVSELPGNPNAVWTVKKNVDDQYHAHIVVSFVNATLVLSIGETVEEVTDSGFLGTTPTIGCGLIGDDSLLQIYPSGIRHIRADRRVNEWRAPPKRPIMKCAINRRQVVISLVGGEIVYFELDMTNQLREYSERREMTAEVLCMSLSEVPDGELRSRFLTVGLADRTVRIISLDPTDCLAPLSMQALPSDPESLMVMETAAEDTGTTSIIHLNIGLQNGCLLRVTLDQVTGDLTDNRTRYLGTKPVKLFRVRVQNKDALFACSSRAWLFYNYQSRFHLTPLSYSALEFASSFSSEQCQEGIVAISENTLRILALEKLGTVFNQMVYPLKYTPRRFVVHPHSQNLIVIETDHASFTEKAKRKRRDELAEEIIDLAKDAEEKALAKEMAQSIRNYEPDETIFGAPRAANGKWASAVRMMNAKLGQTLCHYELPEGEAAYCVELVQFRSQMDSTFVLVGCAVELALKPYQAKGGCIYTFLLTSGGNRFEFIHRTAVDDAVYAIHDFRGTALIGVGNRVRMYDFGKKKLLAKCENRVGTSYFV
ncbi:mono-functional DNA-alkylating methyl methanesulfonate n-term domain-containing protein [Ditylenchus destructor]|uniref:Mono-functional DNA-alkylating methyl methanesulfonate n-term domain-containing protein n=1 Tax=Ditylenchus destructor TaxID=166010 RepID=A0AAD4N3C4_9BILA|nr:mono-functional DNA-alkylating methyl methanesulfonate n-term domain-containing protein [Ditylenchus destructor]